MVNPNVIGHWRQVRAHWLNSTMIMSNWSSIPYLMDNLVQGINTHQVPAYYWTELPNRQFQRFARHPVMEAIEANYNTISIHPFEDGNKRTARLVTAWILKRAGHIPLTVYNREEYINEIETYYNTRQPHGFYEFLLDQMHQTYDEAGQEIARMNTTISNAPSLPCAACRHIHGVRRDKQK